MRIELGNDVIARDGEKIGTVDRLVLDSESHDLMKFVVQRGFFLREDRIVDTQHIDRIDDKGTIYLNVPSTDDRSLPPFVEESFRVATADEVHHLGYGAYTGAAPFAPVWFTPGSTGRVHRPEDEPLFHGAGASSGVIETRDNLPANSMSIDTGTDVVGSDGDKVGEVDEIFADRDGNVAGFTVKAGFIFTNDVQIPMAAVDQVSGQIVRLNITGQQAEAQYTV